MSTPISVAQTTHLMHHRLQDNRNDNETNIGGPNNPDPTQNEQNQGNIPIGTNGNPPDLPQNEQAQEEPPEVVIPQQNPRRPRPNAQGTGQKIDKNTRATLKIASLNIKGRGSQLATQLDNKWNHINQLMRDKQIEILAVQETHLSDHHVQDLHTLFGRCLQIYNSIDPNLPNAKGVAIVLNRNITNTNDVQQWEIIPGRAILISIPWHITLTITILAIYAPNRPDENKTFWKTITDQWSNSQLPFPDIMMGDFNFVEDTIDRMPCHTNNVDTPESFDELKEYFELKDGWRNTNPTTKAYTFWQEGTGSQSRIDRIYMTDHTMESCQDWKTEAPGITTDHQMVSTQLVDREAPFIGRGRWTMPLHLIKDQALNRDIQKMGKKLEENLEANTFNRSEENNPHYERTSRMT